MRPLAYKILFCLAYFLIAPIHAGAQGMDIPLGAVQPVAANGQLQDLPQELQLAVFINDEDLQLVATFSQDAQGRLSMSAQELAAIGIGNPDARATVALDDIAGLAYTVDFEAQSVRIDLGFEQRAIYGIDARANVEFGQKPETGPPSSAFGFLTNYTLYASASDGQSSEFGFDQLSGLFDSRLVGPYGNIDNGYLVRVSENGAFDDPLRLNTTWSYSDPRRLVSWRAGDVVSGGLGWTRPAWLGGIQIQRNFSLRPDLVTLPIPSMSGSAAVPSTVELFVDNALRYSTNVPTGPFRIDNPPLITGSGNARLVVRDALGRETIVESPFFVASEMLAAGMLDFSMEAGFARRYYGDKSFDYDDRPAGMATIRYGVTNLLTLEAHGEGMQDLLNGGIGATTALGRWGSFSVSGAASAYDGRSGYQLGAGVMLDLDLVWLNASTRRSFDDYQDVAGVVALDENRTTLTSSLLRSAAPARAIDQVSLSIPLRFDPSSLNLTYAHIETVENDKYSIIGANFSRQMARNLYMSASAYGNIDDKTYGMQVSFSRQFGEVHASTGIVAEDSGTSAYVEASKRPRWETNDLGYRVRLREGDSTYRGAALLYEASAASLEGGVEQFESDKHVYAEAQGSVAAAGGGVYFTRKVDDAAFAVVDAGAPGVLVRHENRAVGRTGRNGKLLVGGLRSYEENGLSIDPDTLPLDTMVETTSLSAVPAQGGIARVSFGVRAGEETALLTLRMPDGTLAELGREAMLNGHPERFVVGYDGQLFLTGLGASNELVLDLGAGQSCRASFAYRALPGQLQTIDGVVCR